MRFVQVWLLSTFDLTGMRLIRRESSIYAADHIQYNNNIITKCVIPCPCNKLILCELRKVSSTVFLEPRNFHLFSDSGDMVLAGSCFWMSWKVLGNYIFIYVYISKYLVLYINVWRINIIAYRCIQLKLKVL